MCSMCTDGKFACANCLTHDATKVADEHGDNDNLEYDAADRHSNAMGMA